MRVLGLSSTGASLLSTLLLAAAVGGKVDGLVPFERIVEGSAGLAIAGLVADLVFYLTFAAFVSTRGSRSWRAFVGVAFGVIGAVGAVWLLLSWVGDFAGSAEVTRWVYTRVWNGVNALLLAVFMSAEALDGSRGRWLRACSGLTAILAMAVGGAFALGAVDHGGLLVPPLIGLLAIWPALAAWSGGPGQGAETDGSPTKV